MTFDDYCRHVADGNVTPECQAFRDAEIKRLYDLEDEACRRDPIGWRYMNHAGYQTPERDFDDRVYRAVKKLREQPFSVQTNRVTPLFNDEDYLG